METRKFKKGDIIFRQGDAGDCMFDIRWGRVGIYSDYGTDSQKLLTELDPEDFFGAMGMIDHAARSATAVALVNNTSLNVITEQALGELFSISPAKVLMIMQQLSKRLRKLTNEYMDACKTADGIVKVEEKASLDEQTVEEIRSRVAYYADEMSGASDLA